MTDTIQSILDSTAQDACEKKHVGIAIGVADTSSQSPIDAATIFEIGSLTKLFTSTLLAVAETKQELKLDDPVQPSLGDAATLPTDGEKQITFRSLANHRSSLPRIPKNLFQDADMKNPYAHYGTDKLYKCLNDIKKVRPIGRGESYSNLGVGLLGHVLGKIAGSDFSQALQQRVLLPLGMSNTAVKLNEEQSSQLTTSHASNLKPTPHWDFTDAIAAAGGLRSSLPDMMKFLSASLSPDQTPLAEAIGLTQEHSDEPKAPPVSILNSCIVGAVAALLSLLIQLCTGIGPGNIMFLLTISLPILFAGFYRGFLASSIATILTVLFTWLFQGAAFGWFTAIWFGALLCWIGGSLHGSVNGSGIFRGAGCLGWQYSIPNSEEVLWHNGMVGGAASYLAISPKSKVGVVVLTNTARSVDKIGDKLLAILVDEVEANVLP